MRSRGSGALEPAQQLTQARHWLLCSIDARTVLLTLALAHAINAMAPG